MTLGTPSILQISPIVHIIDPFYTAVAANNEHHNPLPLPCCLLICLCRYYSHLCGSILIILIIALSVGHFEGEWWWEGVAQCWSWWQGAMETPCHSQLLPCCHAVNISQERSGCVTKIWKNWIRFFSDSGCWTGCKISNKNLIESAWD